MIRRLDPSVPARAGRARAVRSPVAALALLVAIVVAGCASSKNEFSIPPTATDDPLAQAKASLASGNELAAIERLTKFLQENPGSIHVDEANFLLGQAYLEQKDRVLAADYFQKVTRDFPQSPLAGESSYYLAVSYDKLSRPSSLDQDWTERAIGSYRLFSAKYPANPHVAEAEARVTVLENRLAQKAYENGALYLRMNRPTSAEVYFQRVLEQYPQSAWACRAGVGLGATYVKRRMWEQAVTHLQGVIDACPDADAARKGRDLLAEARRELGRPTATGPTAPADTAGAADSASAP